MPITFGWLGQGDSGGDYMAASNLQYFGPARVAGHVFDGGYVGLTWMKNVFCLSRDYWQSVLSTPYSGQLWPTGGKTGGPGQVFPF